MKKMKPLGAIYRRDWRRSWKRRKKESLRVGEAVLTHNFRSSYSEHLALDVGLWPHVALWHKHVRVELLTHCESTHKRSQGQEVPSIQTHASSHHRVVEARGSRIQSHPWLYSKFSLSHG